ncbi:MAG: pentapeptide repeat-containing protein [Cyanobacteria bacterium J06632_19]
MIGANFHQAKIKHWSLDYQEERMKLDNYAYFYRTDLKRANLSNVNLNSVSFEYTNLLQANLQNANLDNARLDGAILIGADLSGASLNDAVLRGLIYSSETIFPEGTDLSKAYLAEQC